MKKTILTSLLMLLISGSGISQSTTIKYYSNENLSKEVPIKKAKFSQTIAENSDGTITTSIKDIKKDEIISSHTYKDLEPFGIWKIQTSSGITELSYDFALEYSDAECNETINGLTNYFQDNESLNYLAPKISSGEKSIMIYLMKEMKYPPTAADKGISGKVVLQFEIDEKGQIENIKVKNGVHVELDKESMRLIRKLKFSSPAMINSKPQRLCVTFPISYKLM